MFYDRNAMKPNKPVRKYHFQVQPINGEHLQKRFCRLHSLLSCLHIEKQREDKPDKNF